MLTTRGALTRAVAAYQAAQSLTLDDEVRALCDRERQAVALWLPGARPQPTTPAGALRAATRQAPGRLVDACLAMPGADGVLAAGIALLLSGHPEEALQVFRRAAAHPGADSRVLDLTACATAAAQLLMAPPAAAGPPPEGPGRPSGAGDGRPDRSAASGTADQLEALVRRPAPTLPGWWQRIGSALTAAVQQDGPALDLLCEDADADEDLWCGAVIRLLQALAGTADSLAAAQERFTALEAPVLAHWCLCLRVVRDSPPASGPLPAPLAEAARLGRALGARDVLDAVLRRQGRDGDGPARQAPVEDALPQPRDGGPLGPGPAPAPPRVHVRLLGGFELTVDGVPVDLAHVRPRVRSLLHLLSLHAGTFVHRDVLADTLWPDVEAEAGQRGLQVAVSALRGLLEPGTPPRQTALLPRRGDAYGLMLPPGSGTDVQEFETALDHARQARRRGDAAAAMAAWRAALDAYRGDLLPEQGNADWVVQERDRLRLGAAGAAEALGRALRATGADDAALDAVRRALELDPFRDGVWRTLVELHETQGDRAAAQSARLQHRKVLAELGVPFDEA
jgi:DNA-binding SARP family transcriptional activator